MPRKKTRAPWPPKEFRLPSLEELDRLEQEPQADGDEGQVLVPLGATTMLDRLPPTVRGFSPVTIEKPASPTD